MQCKIYNKHARGVGEYISSASSSSAPFSVFAAPPRRVKPKYSGGTRVCVTRPPLLTPASKTLNPIPLSSISLQFLDKNVEWCFISSISLHSEDHTLATRCSQSNILKRNPLPTISYAISEAKLTHVTLLCGMLFFLKKRD